MNPDSILKSVELNQIVPAPVSQDQVFVLNKDMIERMILMDDNFLETNGIKIKNPAINMGQVEFKISFKTQFEWRLTFKTEQEGGNSEKYSQNANYKGSVHLQSNKSVRLEAAMNLNFSMINRVLLQHIYNLRVMKAKIGNDVWSPVPPFKQLMFVGFDVHRRLDPSTSPSYSGILVATAGTSFCSFFTVSSRHPNTEEVGHGLCLHISMAVQSYFRRRGYLPSRIILFRGGIIGYEELNHCFSNEVHHVADCLKIVYAALACSMKPAFNYIAVTQRIKKLDANHASSTGPSGSALPDKFDYTQVPQEKHRGRKRKAESAKA